MSSFINFKNFGDTSHQDFNNTKQMVSNTPLDRQSSIFSLTFDELQTTFGGNGKDFGSMNMDELLKNIWNVEETQTMASTSNLTLDQRQGSLTSLTLPRTFSQKTVDEVWRELLKNTTNGEVKDSNLIKETNLQPPPEREITLGEMTLEDFLMKARVASEKSQNGAFFGDVSQQNLENDGFVFGFQNPNQNHGIQQVAQNNTQIIDCKNGLNLQPKSHPKPIFPKQVALDFTAPLSGSSLTSPNSRIGKSEHPLKIQENGMENGVINVKSPRNLIPKSNFENMTPSPPPFYSFAEGGRKSSGTLEKVVERRRRRMIKNRESAARSRARKQAYTMELEAEIAKLKELNHELIKKQEEIMEMQKNQVVEKMKMPWGNKRLCLRRTSTGPW